ncbi:MAG: hypothetical protein E6Q27_03960 [Aeromicrobium sp.]|nr:MAG: hypothetical protein E6Q27_03960 [Aeromicrobium sp.]
MTDSSGSPADPISETTDVLVRALRALGNAGQPDTASRLAARAWWALKSQHPREAERLNGILHYLARLPEQVDSAPNE